MVPFLGSRLRRARDKHGWSQTYVCQKLGIPNSTLSGYERDYREPDAEMIKQLAQLYDVSIDYLLGRDIEQHGVVYPVGDIKQIPIVAEIPCGTPMVVEENIIGYFPVDTTMVNLNGGEYVWLKAKGDSMINADIRNGSLVLIRLQPEVEDRDIAAVCVDSELATLKRVFLMDERVLLVPENPNMKPSTYERERIRIVGKAIKVINDL